MKSVGVHRPNAGRQVQRRLPVECGSRLRVRADRRLVHFLDDALARERELPTEQRRIPVPERGRVSVGWLDGLATHPTKDLEQLRNAVAYSTADVEHVRVVLLIVAHDSREQLHHIGNVHVVPPYVVALIVQNGRPVVNELPRDVAREWRAGAEDILVWAEHVEETADDHIQTIVERVPSTECLRRMLRAGVNEIGRDGRILVQRGAAGALVDRGGRRKDHSANPGAASCLEDGTRASDIDIVRLAWVQLADWQGGDPGEMEDTVDA